MNPKLYLIYFLCFFINLNYSQTPPLPPKIPKVSKSDKIYGDPDKNDDDKKATKTRKKSEIIDVYNDQSNFGQAKNNIPDFNVSINESKNENSIYYFKNVEALLSKLDTTVTAEQIIRLTKYKINSNTINPTDLDSLAGKAYKLNEDKRYDEAIVVSKEILNQSPNNITGHKEIAYAYKHLGNTNLAEYHFLMMVKIIESVFEYGDGSRNKPFILNNFFE